MVGERLFHIYFLLLTALHYKAFLQSTLHYKAFLQSTLHYKAFLHSTLHYKAFLQSTLHFWRVGALEISHFDYYQRFTVQNMNEFQERDSVPTDVRVRLICIVSLPFLSFILKSFHTVVDFHSDQTSSASNEKHSTQQECHEHTVFKSTHKKAIHLS